MLREVATIRYSSAASVGLLWLVQSNSFSGFCLGCISVLICLNRKTSIFQHVIENSPPFYFVFMNVNEPQRQLEWIAMKQDRFIVHGHI